MKAVQISFKYVFLICVYQIAIAQGFAPYSPSTSRLQSSAHQLEKTALYVVADPPMKDDKQKKGESDSDRDWTTSENGGFIPNIRNHFRRASNMSTSMRTATSNVNQVYEVLDIQDYKREVADVRDKLVCVRFYAPWCRSCKAIESKFRRMGRKFPNVKFVECPVTRENAYLHKGLGVPSLPFGHIYHPTAGLMEETKINKTVFADFQTLLETYNSGQCLVRYTKDGLCSWDK